MKGKTDKKKIAKVVQEAVDKGATTAEEIHRSIANVPITVLESLGLAEETTKNVKKLHDTTIGAIYELVHEINHQVTDLAGELIQSGEKIAGMSGEKKKTAEVKEEA